MVTQRSNGTQSIGHQRCTENCAQRLPTVALTPGRSVAELRPVPVLLINLSDHLPLPVLEMNQASNAA